MRFAPESLVIVSVITMVGLFALILLVLYTVIKKAVKDGINESQLVVTSNQQKDTQGNISH